MSSKKYDICWTFYSEMSSENSKCPAKNGDLNKFHELWLHVSQISLLFFCMVTNQECVFQLLKKEASRMNGSQLE